MKCDKYLRRCHHNLRERCNNKGCPYHLKFLSVGRHPLLQIFFDSIDPPILQNTHILRRSLEQ